MGSFEKNLNQYTSVEKDIDKGKETGIVKDPDVSVERKEEKDFYSLLKNELKEKRSGGADIHFSQMDVDILSNDALDLYEKYKRKKPSFESDVVEFRKNIVKGGNDDNFLAMLLNWHMDYISEKKHKEREERKKLAA